VCEDVCEGEFGCVNVSMSVGYACERVQVSE